MSANSKPAIFDQGPPPPCPHAFNLAAYVLSHAQDLAERSALCVLSADGAERWSYAALEAAVLGTARGFLDQGLRPGDRVLMRLGNSVEFPVCYLASIAADLIPVPTSSLLTAPEVAQIADDVSPALIVAEDGLSLPPEPPCPVISAEAMRQMYALPPADYAMGDPERPAYIIYTSGTSGSPRAVTHAHRAIWARRMMWEGWYGLKQSDRLLHAGAFNWTYTLGTGLMDPWTVGATSLIPDKSVTPDQLGALLAEHEATLFAAAPGIYRRLLRNDLPKLPALRHGLSAGEKLPDATRAAWESATGTPVFEAFGMSECSTFVSGSPSHPAPAGTLGYPQTGRRVAVLGEDGPVAVGAPGVLSVSHRDPGLMLCYWGAEDETKARFQGEWFLTGDMVRMGEDGALTYLGRADDMMNAGGIRVSPIEVEHALNAHPAIAESAAAEVQVKADTTVIAAFYVAKSDVATEELERFAAERLAGYKCPRIYAQVEALPKGANGKLLRRALREAYEKSHSPA
ncbi:class I adenylate-forming enzyme family protein [Methyloligella sp. 2.7D]|uniref:class I adenylate-forming enzyme family protein n=1 Tax=unclassified Methyloligella TaxID=2625955 RepID=UPI00157DE1B9|nr:class I adenylate-forming enzyme family protein [Methyloligella sp. GL2]QKP78134.1 acyl--CoA ligase [Methyloligella sp. GL2]